ncbi:MAG: hypothetical protein QOH50_1051 [Kribbellaceae bacterium]|jgi:hypothetical protein|nr:hypothetical protein [Kribbellaceae bacterium]
MPFLPCTRRKSALISFSTFRSARTLILWTSWISSSTRPSVSSVLRTQHSAASSVHRRAFQDAYSNSESVWSGEKADLQGVGPQDDAARSR